MADVKRTVQVDISVTGANKKTLGDLASVFDTLATSVQNVSTNIGTLKTSLDSLKVPDNLTTIVSSMKEVSKIKVPNIKQIAQGFERLAAIKKPPDLSKFAAEAAKFNDIKVPNIKQLAQGLDILTSSSLSMAEASKRLNAIYYSLKQFSNIRVPNISKIAKGLQELNLVASVNTNTASLTKLVTAIQALNGVKVPNLQKLTDGLIGLSRLNLDQAGTSIEKLARSLTLFTGTKVPTVSGLVSGLQKLIALDIEAVKTRIKNLDAALKQLDKQGFLKSFAKFASDLRNISAELGKAQGALNNYSAAVQRAERQSRGFGERVKNYFQYRIIADAVFKIKEAIIGSWNAIRDYDQALKDLQAITGATGLEVEQMGDTIKEVASKTKFSASEVAEGMRIIGQAGFSAAESVQTMQAVADLATGTLSQMSTTVDLVTTAMRVFKIDASESAAVADVFANAVNRSKLTIDKLRTSFNYVGPIARDVGVSFKEMSAAMMTLANSGLRASTIGTGLRRVFAELAAPSEKMTLAAKRAGIALADLDPKSQGLQAVVANLGIVIDDASVAFDLFGKRGAAAALALTDSKGQFNEMLSTVGRSGIAAQQAAKQMEGLGVSFKNLQDKIGLLAISLGESGIAAALKILIDLARNLVDAFNVLLQNSFTKFVIQAGLITAAVWGIVAALKALEIAAGLRLFLVMAQNATAATFALVSLEGVAASLLLIFNPLVVLAGVFAVALTSIGLKAASAEKSSKALSDSSFRLATEIGHLIKAVENYRTKVSSLDEDSKEFADANKELREDLLETASGMSELADEAERAALSIDPLTGLFYDQGQALRDYNDALRETQITKFVESINTSFDALEAGTGRFGRSLNFMKTSLSDVGEAAAIGIGDFFYNALLSVTQPLKLLKGEIGGFGDTLNVFENSGAIRGAYDFAKGLNEGVYNFQDLNNYVESFRGQEMNAQMKALKDHLTDIKDKITPVFEYLRQIGTIDTSYTVTEMEKILVALGLNNDAVQALLVKFNDLKNIELGGFSNIVEKWQNELKDTNNQYEGLIKTATDAGLAVSESAKESLKSSEEAKRGLIARLEAAKAVRDEAIDEKSTFAEQRKAYAEYYASLEEILKDAKEVQKKYADNTVAQDADALTRLLANRNEQLKKAHILFEKDAAGLEKRIFEINRTFAEESRKITDHIVDPKEHLADTKVAVKAIQEEYVRLYKEIELAVLTGNKSRAQAAIERRKLEKEEADKIIAIWVAAEAAIARASYGEDTAQTRAAAKSRLDAQIKLGNLTVKQAKAILEAEAKTREDAYELMDAKRATAYAAFEAKIDKEVADGVKTYEEGEIAKIKATIDFHEKALRSAKAFRLGIDKELDPEGYQEALKDELKAEEELWKARGKAAEDAAKIAEDLREEEAKAREASYEKLNAAREASYKKYEAQINKEVADGVISYEEGEVKKLESTIRRYEQSLQAARAFRAGIDQEKDKEGYQQALQDELKAEEDLWKAKSDAQEKYNKKAKTLNEEIIKDRRKLVNEEQDHADDLFDIKKKNAQKLVDIEDDYADSIRDINYTLQDKLKELEEKRVENAQKYADKRKDIEDDFAASLNESADDIDDAINKLQIKDLDEKNAERKKEGYAISELAELEKRLTEARKEGNLEEVKSILDRTDKIKDLYSNLSNTSQAIRGLKKLKTFREEALEVNKDLQIEQVEAEEKAAEEKLQKDIKREKELHTRKITDLEEEYNEKLAKQEDAFIDAIAKENKRHEEAMANIRIEAQAKLKAAIQIAKAQQALDSAKGPDAAKVTASGQTESSSTSQTGQTSGTSKIDAIEKDASAAIDAATKSGTAISNVLQNAIDLSEDAGKEIKKNLSEGFSDIPGVKKAETDFEKLKGAVGLVEEGTIDLKSRLDQIGKGEFLTVTDKGVSTLIPTVDKLGNKLSQFEAIDLFKKTGEHLGKFDTIQKSLEYAKQLRDVINEVDADAKDGTTVSVKIKTNREDFDRFIEYAENLDVEPKIQVDVEIEKAKAKLDELNKAKEEGGLDSTEKIQLDLQISNAKDKLGHLLTLKEDLERVNDVKIGVTPKINKEEIEKEAQKAASGKPTEIPVKPVFDSAAYAKEQQELENKDKPEVEIKAVVAFDENDNPVYEGDPVEVPTTPVIDETKIDALKKSLEDIGKNIKINIEINSDEVDKLIDKLDSIDGRTTRSTHIVKQITTGAAAMGGLASDLIQKFANGGAVFKRLASPFITTGSGFKDDVPALLKKNEFVQRTEAVKYYGVDFMRALNSLRIPKHMVPGFETGGLVGALGGDLGGASSAPIKVNFENIVPGGESIEASMTQFSADALLEQLAMRNKYRS